jgi:predicted DNA binding protein
MVIVGEFQIPVEEFPLAETLGAIRDANIKFVRVTISPEVISPYCWVAADATETLVAAIRADPTVERVRQLDDFDGQSLLRIYWDESAPALATTYAGTEASVLSTRGTGDGWYLRIQFPAQESLGAFRDSLRGADVSFRTLRLTSGGQPHPGNPFGLTEKQTEALVGAWEAGYYETPRRAGLEAVAEELGISQQSLSERLRRANQTLLANTVVIPADRDSISRDIDL